MTVSLETHESLPLLLRTLKLPTFLAQYDEMASRAERHGWTFAEYLRQLACLEVVERKRRRIERNLKRSTLPAEKILETLDVSKFPAKVRRQIPQMCEGGFVDQAENLLVFGMPGTGKSHLLCAVGHNLIMKGYTVLFTQAFRLVQRLLAAKRDLKLEQELGRLDRFDAVILDDIGYIQQDREEMEVLFTFLAERYERRSVMITSNLVFSQWDKIFKDPMTTAAAIDRLVHHSTILELTGPSYRTETAKSRNKSASKKEQPKATASNAEKNGATELD